MLDLILISSIFNSKVCFFYLNYNTPISSSQFSFGPKISLSQPFYFGTMFNLHNSVQPKQPFSITSPIDCLPPRVNPDDAQLWLPAVGAHRHATASFDRLSVREPSVVSHAHFPF
jgi:hypothetical protein